MPAPANLVHETATSTGSSDLTVSSVNGKQAFSTAFSTGGTNVFDYFISNRSAAEWERGTGHMSDSATLVRDTVLETHAGTTIAINFSTGTKDITNDIPALSQVRATTIATSGALAVLDTTAGNLLKGGSVMLTTAAMFPTSADGITLGTTANEFADLFLASGGVVKFSSGTSGATVTHSAGNLDVQATTVTLAGVKVSTASISPSTAGGVTLGTAALPWGNANIGGIAITTASVAPATNDGVTLGTSALKFADLYLALGGVVDFSTGDATITHSAGNLSIQASTVTAAGVKLTTLAILPATADGIALGSTALEFSDLFLASGAVIKMSSGTAGATITHSANNLDVQATTVTIAGVKISTSSINPSTAGGVTLGTAALPWGNANIGGATITTASLNPTTAAGMTLGTAALPWGNANIGGVTITTASINPTSAQGLTLGTAALPFGNANFGGVTVTTVSLAPTSNDGITLGTSALKFADLFLASGAVIDMSTGNVTMTHGTSALTVTASTITLACTQFTLTAAATADIVSVKFTTAAVRPTSNDGVTLGTSAFKFADLFLAAGGIIQISTDPVTLTGGTSSLTVAASTIINTGNQFTVTAVTADIGSVKFTTSSVAPATNDGVTLGTSANKWADLFLASGAVIDMSTGNVTMTHGTSALTVLASTITLTCTQFTLTSAATADIVSVKFTTASVRPATNDGVTLGTSAFKFADLYLALGGVIDFSTANATITHAAGSLTIAASTIVTNSISQSTAAIYPTTNDGVTLGTSANKWADLYLASGAVIDFSTGNVTLTHGTSSLTVVAATFAVTSTQFAITGASSFTGTMHITGATTQAGTAQITGNTTIGGILTLTTGAIKFPGTQIANADANTLDDYEEGTFTPTVGFSTLGTFSVTYTAQTGAYTKIGNRIQFNMTINASTIAFGTAAGFFQIGGFPFTFGTQFLGAGWVGMRGYTKANFTQTGLETGTTFFYVLAAGSAQQQTELAIADMTSVMSIYGNGHAAI